VEAQGTQTPVQATGTSSQSNGVLFVSRGQLAGIVLGIFFGLLLILLIVMALLALLFLVSSLPFSKDWFFAAAWGHCRRGLCKKISRGDGNSTMECQVPAILDSRNQTLNEALEADRLCCAVCRNSYARETRMLPQKPPPPAAALFGFLPTLEPPIHCI